MKMHRLKSFACLESFPFIVVFSGTQKKLAFSLGMGLQISTYRETEEREGSEESSSAVSTGSQRRARIFFSYYSNHNQIIYITII